MYVQYQLTTATTGLITAIYTSIEGYNFEDVLIEEFADDEMPKAKSPAGTFPILMIDVSEHKLYYDYRQIPQSPEIRILSLEKENQLLKAQLSVQSERSDFIEDVITELATQLYK
ncbi:hypothetical protein NST69_27515 [Paenibacillus sp. FSL P2-0089]|uniref:hypothetical protein n=1 Tax=Paenibacillus sp. FSL P2-0089 TaxID=2954526 RepID=UPI00315AF1C2